MRPRQRCPHTNSPRLRLNELPKPLHQFQVHQLLPPTLCAQTADRHRHWPIAIAIATATAIATAIAIAIAMPTTSFLHEREWQLDAAVAINATDKSTR